MWSFIDTYTAPCYLVYNYYRLQASLITFSYTLHKVVWNGIYIYNYLKQVTPRYNI
jgi:hypothetical protein